MATEAEALERRVVNLKGENRYCVVGIDGAVDFHFQDLAAMFPDKPSLRAFDITAGLECHYRRCPTYMRGKEPFSEQCWLTGGRCWGDGTSLYATEYLLPLFQGLGVDDFWPILEDEYRKRFSSREISFVQETP